MRDPRIRAGGRAGGAAAGGVRLRAPAEHGAAGALSPRRLPLPMPCSPSATDCRRQALGFARDSSSRLVRPELTRKSRLARAWDEGGLASRQRLGPDSGPSQRLGPDSCGGPRRSGCAGASERPSILMSPKRCAFTRDGLYSSRIAADQRRNARAGAAGRDGAAGAAGGGGAGRPDADAAAAERRGGAGGGAHRQGARAGGGPPVARAGPRHPPPPAAFPGPPSLFHCPAFVAPVVGFFGATDCAERFDSAPGGAA